MNHGLTLIVSFFSLVQTSFRESGEVSLTRTVRVFRKAGQSLWLRGDSALGPPVYSAALHFCIVLLSEFVSQNLWLQPYEKEERSPGGKETYLEKVIYKAT